jgi:hypothetical protein
MKLADRSLQRFRRDVGHGQLGDLSKSAMADKINGLLLDLGSL